MNRTITERQTEQGNKEVIITQDGYDFVNIKGTTTVNIYRENDYLKGKDALECYNLGNPKDSFKRYVTFWLRENNQN